VGLVVNGSRVVRVWWRVVRGWCEFGGERFAGGVGLVAKGSRVVWVWW